MVKLESKIFRVIDANLNRSREGLRVCEEIARFILNSSALTKELRDTRHKISKIKKDMSKSNTLLIASRDTESDVGRRNASRFMTPRKSHEDILTANLERVKESLRVLEEFCRVIDESLSSRFANLRFAVYDIEKRVTQKIKSAL